MKIAALFAMIALSGCATCHRHPMVCSAAGAFVVASVALSVGHSDDQQPGVQVNPVPRPVRP